MKQRRTLRNWGVVFLFITWVTLLLVPGAGAQSKYTSLYKFRARAGGRYPSGLIFDQSGNLYGTTVLGGANGLGTVFKLTPSSGGSWTESVLYSFCSLSNCADGSAPVAGVIFDGAGNLYGTTINGGSTSNSICNGCGVVFKLIPNRDGSWTESVLYSFCSLRLCVDGAEPASGVTFDQAGNLYGTTTIGGPSSACGLFGCGTVFKLTHGSGGSWTESVLHGFCSFTNCADGKVTFAGVIFDGAGNLYGTTPDGGNLSQCLGHGCGVVYELTPKADGSWKAEILHRFTGGRDGARPQDSLLFDGNGNLYGATAGGGNLTRHCEFGCGVVFELVPDSHGGWKEKVLHSFAGGGGSGFFPFASLVLDKAGNLYGTALFGGDLRLCSANGCGVVFELTPNSNGGWTETVLHRFLDHPGAEPGAGLILDAAGNVYGATSGDGSTTFGSVFEITP
jgi:uncharacterized repeat protein (TIGR03803 family)